MGRNVVDRLLGISRGNKRAAALSLDICLCMATVIVAYYLRLGQWTWPAGVQWASIIAAPIIAIPIFIRCGLYRAIFRYSGSSALAAAAMAAMIYGIIYAAIFTLYSFATVPRTVGLIQPILLFLAIGGSRAFVRFWLGGAYDAIVNREARSRVLIYGAGTSGRQLAAALSGSSELKIIGFIDDNPALSGSILAGHKIYAGYDLPGLFAALKIDDVLLALPTLSRKRRNEIVERMRGTSVAVRTLPGLNDLAQGRVTVNDLRELDIEDLLGRDPVVPDATLLSKNIAGKTVLVTGAGGSIGSELCRQILWLNPASLLLADMNEYNLYAIHGELEHQRQIAKLETQIRPLLANVIDAARMESIMTTWVPDTVYHAAAYKHVPLVEHNPAQGVHNNVFGTITAARAAAQAGVSDFVLISTDKAVRPTNVMGASKRLAEMALQALAAEKPNTRFSMVRFGNVLGSSGSVVPLFREQIKRGGPVTLTHAEITRYFMTIPEAAQLVIQAGAMAVGGEVFVLDMGEPVKIIDLARKMIELSGSTVRDADNPDGEIEIETVGLRPGEKLYEELLIGNNPEPTSHKRIMKANEIFLPIGALQIGLDSLIRALNAHDAQMVRDNLKMLVSDYTPDSEMADWVMLERRKSPRAPIKAKYEGGLRKAS
ncbi:polysaccharide biosynthesis protein [Sphingorhabdus arenilitoris]|uniref:Polysaccharide biosynthesis protein n=1 Tax=Sphingorhabdus arenilitoris TaxID=1490041 RepID=A0ABV8RLW7_9SPHN